MRNSRYYDFARFAKAKGRTFKTRIQFALRSELWKLIWISRIALPGALYDASISVQTCGEVEQGILNPVDIDNLVDVNIAKSTADIKFPHIQGYSGFLALKTGDSNRVNWPHRNKKLDTSITHFAVRNLMYF